MYEQLYTKNSASLVILENQVTRTGQDPESANDRRTSSPSTPLLIGYGEQYAHPITKTRYRRPPPQNYRNNNNRRYPSALRTGNSMDRSKSGTQFKTNREIETHCFKCGRKGH